ncbi:hypothetical protein [Hymenobacter jeollabukensis]|uniref:Uncharacterized protein n=1 Tax=Hymenobacter jeollabukensis TaxID=2025313 RepID=A0A5R8WQQ4_9BACT|nr:hypothetical protein [Hymenobacter jeollabukensis]TLM93078.1 hypothetical protein FDY95_10610 [Hymenobacter jeollabukensis]
MKNTLLLIGLALVAHMSYGQIQGQTASKSTIEEASVHATRTANDDTRIIQWNIKLTPDGDVKKVLDGEKITPVNGSLGFSAERYITYVAPEKDEEVRVYAGSINFLVNLASTVDTLRALFDANGNITNRKLFGTTLLLPTPGGRFGKAILLNFDYLPFHDSHAKANEGLRSAFFRELAISGYFNASSTQWQLSDKNVKDTRIMAGALYAQWDIITTYMSIFNTNQTPKNTFRFSPFIGYTFRHIGGDIQLDKPLRTAVLGTDKNFFSGIDAGCSIFVNNLRVSVSFPYFRKQNIEGFGKSQFVTSFGISANLNLDTIEKMKTTKLN